MGRRQHGHGGRQAGAAARLVSPPVVATSGGGVPMRSSLPVWKAMRSRLALAAGWQKPK